MRKFLWKAPKLLLFHERFPEPHVNAALDLAAHQRRVQRASNVVRDPNLRNGDPSSYWIYFDFDDRSGIRIGGRRAYAAPLLQRRRFRRTLEAHPANRAQP